ncbi:12169_t:CDS:1, partial [Funneliformis geosporum]
FRGDTCCQLIFNNLPGMKSSEWKNSLKQQFGSLGLSALGKSTLIGALE